MCVSHSAVAVRSLLTALWVFSPPPPPGIPQKPQIFGHEQPIDEEKVARLICRSSGSKPAAQLRWRKGNRELKGGWPCPEGLGQLGGHHGVCVPQL